MFTNNTGISIFGNTGKQAGGLFGPDQKTTTNPTFTQPHTGIFPFTNTKTTNNSNPTNTTTPPANTLNPFNTGIPGTAFNTTNPNQIFNTANTANTATTINNTTNTTNTANTGNTGNTVTNTGFFGTTTGKTAQNTLFDNKVPPSTTTTTTPTTNTPIFQSFGPKAQPPKQFAKQGFFNQPTVPLGSNQPSKQPPKTGLFFTSTTSSVINQQGGVFPSTTPSQPPSSNKNIQIPVTNPNTQTTTTQPNNQKTGQQKPTNNTIFTGFGTTTQVPQSGGNTANTTSTPNTPLFSQPKPDTSTTTTPTTTTTDNIMSGNQQTVPQTKPDTSQSKITTPLQGVVKNTNNIPSQSQTSSSSPLFPSFQNNNKSSGMSDIPVTTTAPPPSTSSTQQQQQQQNIDQSTISQQRLSLQYQNSNKTSGEYIDQWKKTLIECYQQINKNCQLIKLYEQDRKQNYSILKNFKQLQPVVAQNRKQTELVLDSIEKRQMEMMSILGQIKEEVGNDINPRHMRENIIATQIKQYRNLRKEVNEEDERYPGGEKEDASNEQLKNIFLNLDSVQNQIRRLNYLLDHFFGKFI